MYEVLRSRGGDRVLQAVYLAAIINNNYYIPSRKKDNIYIIN